MLSTTAPRGLPPRTPSRDTGTAKMRRRGQAASPEMSAWNPPARSAAAAASLTRAGTSLARDDATTWPAGLTTAMAR